jgi:predicted DNA-binding antitoxin AbrB/MazE fold protein
MTQTVEAVFDGLVFRPLEPPELAPYTRVRLVVEPTTLDFSLVRREIISVADQESPAAGDAAASMDEITACIYENYVYSQTHRGDR